MRDPVLAGTSSKGRIMSARRHVPEVSSESLFERFKKKILCFVNYCFL